MLRPPRSHETESLISIADSTGVWKPGEANELLGWVLREFHAGRLGQGHEVLVMDNGSGQPIAWTYFAPSFKADGVWDVWWMGADATVHGQGVGMKLLKSIEDRIREAQGRVIVIETSSTPPLEKARKFYPRQGYRLCGAIPDFYGSSDDKIIFAKTLS